MFGLMGRTALASVGCEDVVEQIVREVRRRREELVRLFEQPGQLVVHVNQAATQPIKLEVRVVL